VRSATVVGGPAAAGAKAQQADAKLQRLTQGPILSTLLRLAVPNVLAMGLTVLVGIAETYYVGRLGTTPLVAMALFSRLRC
jgi:Na+-driven multidrug efflux pump